MSDLVKKCVLRVEVDNNNEMESEGGAEAYDTSSNCKTRGQRSVRDISVETFPSRLETPHGDWGLLPDSSRGEPPKEAEGDEVGFFSGNPFVELTKGILHLYKEDALSSSEEALTICLLAVPNSMTCHDLLNYTAPCHADIAHIRVLRDSTPNQYMVLLTFRSHGAAREFHATYNGAPYNTLEPDALCRAVWVSRVEWACDGFAPPGHTELPTCPVCLERMDESVDGVLTILCNHAFHAGCLGKWGDATCPVCRCVQSPELADGAECDRCGKPGPPADALWICLICGHVGCGRYQGGHAASHYRESGHCYALQLGSHRVWDYKGDNFVHRLLQNKGDGKLVPSERPPSEAECMQEKVDSVQLEFTYLLTLQLDEQRSYFEDKLSRLSYQAVEETKSLREKLTSLAEENKQLKEKVSNVSKEKSAVERKLQQQTTKLTATLTELAEERQLGKALRANQQHFQARAARADAELAAADARAADLREQLRDLMFFVEARTAVERSECRDEIAAGTVTVGAAAAPEPKDRERERERDGRGGRGRKKR